MDIDVSLLMIYVVVRNIFFPISRMLILRTEEELEFCISFMNVADMNIEH